MGATWAPPRKRRARAWSPLALAAVLGGSGEGVGPGPSHFRVPSEERPQTTLGPALPQTLRTSSRSCLWLGPLGLDLGLSVSGPRCLVPAPPGTRLSSEFNSWASKHEAWSRETNKLTNTFHSFICDPGSSGQGVVTRLS